MIRARLLLLIFAICLAAESSRLLERTKREADGKKIECYSGLKFEKTENITGAYCGYIYKYLGHECTTTVPIPLPIKNSDFEEMSNFEVGVDGDRIPYRSVKCKCKRAMCNEEEKFPECLKNAAEKGSIKTNNLTVTELDAIIQCVMKNTSLKFQEFVNLYTTTTTTPSTTTTTMPSTATHSGGLSTVGTVSLAILCAIVLLGIGGLIVYCCIKHFSNKSETKNKDIEEGEKKKQMAAKSKDTVTTPTNMSTVSPAEATVTHAKTTVSQKTSEDDKVPGAKEPKRESKVESAVKSNQGSIVKSNVKSVGQSSISTDSEAPRDITGLLATVYKIIKKGAENVYDEFVNERKRICDTTYSGIEWTKCDAEKPNSVVGNRKCLVNNNLKHPIVKEYKKAQKVKEADQINAHYVDKERSIIVSESPSHQNMTDFLLLLYLYDVCAAISVSSFDDMEDGCSYVPEEKTKTFGCFTVRKVKSQQITAFISVNEIEIYLNGTNPRNFVSIHLMKKGYDKLETYDNAARVLDYIQRHVSTKISCKSPIIFHCADGGDNSSSMAMLHMTIAACGTQKQAVNYAAIFEDVLCARREAIKTRAGLVFILRMFIDYARHLNVIKAYELGTWRRDVENLMKRVLEEDKNDQNSSKKKMPAVSQ